MAKWVSRTVLRGGGAGGRGISTNTVYLFLADNLETAKASIDVTASDLTSQWIPLSEFRQRIRNGKITDAGTLAAWAMYQEQIASRTIS